MTTALRYGSGGAPVPQKQQAPSHPEVNQENTTSLEPNNQILAAPLQRRDGLARELGGRFHGVVRPRQACVVDLDVLERPADEMRLEADPDRLDFG